MTSPTTSTGTPNIALKSSEHGDRTPAGQRPFSEAALTTGRNDFDCSRPAPPWPQSGLQRPAATPKTIPALLRQAIEAYAERCRILHGDAGRRTVTIRVCERIPSGEEGPTKPTKGGFGGFGGAGARYILTNFDLLDAGASSREQGRASSQPETAIRGGWPISDMVFNKHRAGAARPKRSCR